MTFGYIIIVFGAFLLLKNLGVINLNIGFWYLFYPLVFIALGVCFVLGTQKIKKYWKVTMEFLAGGADDNDKMK